MSFKWRDYFELAEYLYEEIASAEDDSLSTLPDTEAFYRTVVSRAYYAVFALARNYAKENDGFQSFGNDHQELQKHFMYNSHRKLRVTIGRQLKRLHQDRIKVDYHDNLHENAHNSANKALQQARNILSNLENL